MSDEEYYDQNDDDLDGADWAERLSDEEPNQRPGRLADAFAHHRRFSATNIYNTYPRDWRAISDEIRTQASYCCQKCGIDLNARRHLLHVHHIDHNKDNNQHYNLIAVCVLCHSNYHGIQNVGSNLTSDDYKYLRALQRLR